MNSIRSLSENQITQRFEKRGKYETLNPTFSFLAEGAKPSAVLLPLFRNKGTWQLLFIRRTVVAGDVHSGQVAFPGGRPIPNEKFPESTALRETEEEIGIRSKDIKIVGQLNQTYTVTKYLISAIVGIIPWPYDLTLSPPEVSRAFSIPLEWLAKSGNYEEIFRPLPRTNRVIPVIFFKPYDGEILWGASARITLDLLKTLQLI